MTEKLFDLVRKNNVILFVGAGLSAALGVPTWQGLMGKLADELGFDREIFCGPGANYLTLAEYYKLEKGSIGDLRSWMDQQWQIDDDTLSKSAVHRAITQLEFPIIYTTNFDRNLERAHELADKSFQRIVEISDLMDCKTNQTQIIKFHGDFSSDDSIVLTETDYYERLSFETPLDIKLRADTLEKSVLFIGYSLTDINIRLLLHKLSRFWNKKTDEKKRPRSYIFLPQPDEIQAKVLSQWGVSVLSGECDDQSESLLHFLNELLGAQGKDHVR